MNDPRKVVQVTPDLLEPLIQAGEIIRNQGIVIFPTQCLYGVGANALDPLAVQKVFDIKQRPKDNPILVLIQDLVELKSLVKKIPHLAQVLMDRFWPGSLTLVFEATDSVSPLLTAHTGKIGIRLPAHPIAKALVQQAQGPITGTSANLSGQPGTSRISQLPPSMIQTADLILDAGTLKGGTGSTIVDVTCDPVCILRQGAIADIQIQEAIHQDP